MSQRNDQMNPVVIFGLLLLVGIVLAVYQFLKGWAESWGLDVHSVFMLSLGAIVVIAAVWAGLGWANLDKHVVLPWMLPLYGFFTLPALDVWASHPVGPSFLREVQDPSWYGTWWGQALIILALCGAAYGIMKVTEDSY